jgi:tetratricopeptide (TPR) repeat protein
LIGPLRKLAILGIAAVCPAWPQQGQLDGSETLFTVLAAINAAGYDADLDSPANHPLRRQVRDYLAARRLASVAKLKTFFEEHRQPNWAAELSQYVSFALLVNGPPDFKFQTLTYQLPPDAQSLQGLGPLLAEFYREADIHSLWQKAQPYYDEVIARYHEPTSQAILELNVYLRNPTSGVSGRRFMVIISLLGAPNQIHTRSYEGNYYVVVTPSAEPQIEDIRYAYLHYLLEPIVTRYQDKLLAKKALGDYALGAPYLEEHYKQDFLLLATSSLIRAIEARLAKAPLAEKRKLVDQAWRRGFILTPHFWEQLPAYEQQQQAMRFYFPEMVDAIDLRKEEARVRDLEFDQTPPVRKARQVAAPAPEPAPAEKLLAEAEDLYRRRELDPARELFLRLLRETPPKPVQAKAYYGLARIATLKNDPELAASLFEKTLETSPEPPERAWALVYLGRLNDVAGRHEEALGYYRAALAVEGATEAAQKAARQGLEGAFAKAPASADREPAKQVP